MGKLIIDGNSVFEIDEECIKKKKISKKCGLDKYLNDKTYIIVTHRESIKRL